MIDVASGRPTVLLVGDTLNLGIVRKLLLRREISFALRGHVAGHEHKALGRTIEDLLASI